MKKSEIIKNIMLIIMGVASFISKEYLLVFVFLCLGIGGIIGEVAAKKNKDKTLLRVALAITFLGLILGIIQVGSFLWHNFQTIK